MAEAPCFIFLNLLLSEYQIFAGEKVPQIDECGSYDFGEHIVGADTVGKKPNEKVVEPKPYNPYCGEEEKLDNAVFELRIVENPNATDDIVDEKPCDKRKGGREQVVQPGVFGEDIEQSEIDHKSKSADKEIAYKLHEQFVGGTVEQFLEQAYLFHLLS